MRVVTLSSPYLEKRSGCTRRMKGRRAMEVSVTVSDRQRRSSKSHEERIFNCGLLKWNIMHDLR